MHEVTALLQQACRGDRAAADRLYAAVYQDLRSLAARQLGRLGRPDMRATSLVHEMWFRLGRPDAMPLNDRQHFFAVAARAMRQLAIDHVRERAAGKRGGGREALPLEFADAEVASQLRDSDLLALDQALTQLRELEPALADLVEMRFFAGLEIEEVAQLTGRSASSVKRDWRRARAFLHGQLGETDDALSG